MTMHTLCYTSVKYWYINLMKSFVSEKRFSTITIFLDQNRHWPTKEMTYWVSKFNFCHIKHLNSFKHVLELFDSEVKVIHKPFYDACML